jgi:hypothetical protein
VGFCAVQAEVTDDRGMVIRITDVLPDLSQYDLIFIPGGMSTRYLSYYSLIVQKLSEQELSAMDIFLQRVVSQHPLI